MKTGFRRKGSLSSAFATKVTVVPLGAGCARGAAVVVAARAQWRSRFRTCGFVLSLSLTVSFGQRHPIYGA